MLLKNKKTAVFALAAALMLTGCGWVKSPDALYKQAKNAHGDCTVVSKTKTSDRSVVVLHDTLQNFDYEVASTMNDISIDGSSFGSLPGVSDNFGLRLREKVAAVTANKMNDICGGYGVNYEIKKDNSISIFVEIYSDNEDNARSAALECAALIQNENKANRLDGIEIGAYKSGYDKYGSVKLPNIVWRTRNDEKADYYTETVHNRIDKNAVFVRMEKGVFSQTGASLDKVVNALGTDFPTSDDSPVEFYYFKDLNGKEFYICDFNYYNEEDGNFSYYTNYDGAVR